MLFLHYSVCAVVQQQSGGRHRSGHSEEKNTEEGKGGCHDRCQRPGNWMCTKAFSQVVDLE